jgi:N-sulfoglucosamine sulfohydrolase
MPFRALTLLALFVLLAHAPAARGAEVPNILLVLSDDQSWAHLGCYGNPDIKTPNIDAFAREGMRFDRYYVGTPQCVPSRATLMTGRSAIAVQNTRFSAPLAADYRTYLETLKDKGGYFTGVAGRTYHLDGGALPPETQKVFEEHGLKTFSKRLDYVKTTGQRPEMIAQYREFLDAVPKGKPFALQLCFSDPHRPLDKNAIPTPHDPAKIKLPAFYPDTRLVREDFARYYDEISRFDSDVRTVLAELQKRGLADNTLVVVSADNGAAQFRGKGTLYEFGIHCPLIVRWPGKVKPGSTSSELISGEDVAPTFLAAAGVEIPKEISGRNFLRLREGEKYSPREYVFAQRGAHGSGLPTNSAAFDLGRCVVSKKYKLIYNALWQIPYHPVDFAGDAMWKELVQMNKDGKLPPELAALYFAPTRPMFELYDLENDPNELKNLAGTADATEERKLKAALQEWMILQRDFVPLPIPPPAKKKKP